MSTQIRRARIVACAMSLSLALCTGCRGTGPASPPRSRVLRVNIEADPAMMDPITYSELLSGDILGNMYESFTGLDADGNVVPALATSWEADDDNLGFRFHLREGVHFHSGRELTADDVKWSLEQLLIPGNRAGLNAKYAAAIEGAEDVEAGKTKTLRGVTVVDGRTLDVRFRAPEVLFPIYPLYVMERRAVEEGGEGWATRFSAGTGPFSFAEWKRGQAVRLRAHREYWGGAPAVEGVDFLVVPSDETAISMYEAGELDVAAIKPPATRRALQDERFRPELLTKPAAQIQYLGMNQALYSPFRDIRVREAMCLALDLDGMSKGLYDGAAKPLAGQVTEGVAGYNPELSPVPYDPERAKALLAAAGYPGGKGLPPVAISGTEPNRMELAYFANQLESVLGLPVEVRVVERGTHLQAMNAGQEALFPWAWSAAYPDGLYFLRDVWYGPSIYNRSRWQNDQFDRLIEKAAETADNESRYEIYHQAEKILLDSWGTCPLVVRLQVALVKPYVEGVTLTAFRFLPFGTVRFR
jgi:peptide/nickel transport system substrate-binding protein